MSNIMNIIRKKHQPKWMYLLMAVVCLLIVAAIGFTIYRNYEYKKGLDFQKWGKYDVAIVCYEWSYGYKDANERIINCKAELEKQTFNETLKNANVGDYITFGNYEQDNNLKNGKEPIEWRIIKKSENGCVWLISKYALDCKIFEDQNASGWRYSSLRYWLNQEFLKEAFSVEEQKLIDEAYVPLSVNPEYPQYHLKDAYTKDKVFLLSIDEALILFETDSDRQCAPTAYAIANGANASNVNTPDGEPADWWWLRNFGMSWDTAAGVHIDGSIMYYGDYTNYEKGRCVRPSIMLLPSA